MLRTIAEIAREEGEDLADPRVRGRERGFARDIIPGGTMRGLPNQPFGEFQGV